MRLVGVLVMVSVGRAASAAPGPPQAIYLDRCTGGCTITGTNGGVEDAVTHMSAILEDGTYTLSEFATVDGQVGAAADADWGQVVQCVQQVFSPYGVEVTDQLPTAGSYDDVYVAGVPSEIGFGANY